MDPEIRVSSDDTISVFDEIVAESKIEDSRPEKFKEAVVTAANYFQRNYSLAGKVRTVEEHLSEKSRNCYLPTFTLLLYALKHNLIIGISIMNNALHPICLVQDDNIMHVFDFINKGYRYSLKKDIPTDRFIQIADEKELVVTIKIFDILEQLFEAYEQGNKDLQQRLLEILNSLDWTEQKYFYKYGNTMGFDIDSLEGES